jgi:hypothetical protein
MLACRGLLAALLAAAASALAQSLTPGRSPPRSAICGAGCCRRAIRRRGSGGGQRHSSQGWSPRERQGWRTPIAAERVFGTSSGRGGLGRDVSGNRDERSTDRVFAGLLLVVAIGLVVEPVVFASLERVTVRRWRGLREPRPGVPPGAPPLTDTIRTGSPMALVSLTDPAEGRAVTPAMPDRNSLLIRYTKLTSWLPRGTQAGSRRHRPR